MLPLYYMFLYMPILKWWITLCFCRAERPIVNNEFRSVAHQQQQDRGDIMNIPNLVALQMYEQNHAEMEEQNGDEV